MSVGVLAVSHERARYIIRTDPFLADLGLELIPLSAYGRAYRGIWFAAIFVDPPLWPLSKELAEKLGPCCDGFVRPLYMGLHAVAAAYEVPPRPR